MPCYNLGDYIDESIESLEYQTYNNFEVMIADDASTDKNTINKLKKLNYLRISSYSSKIKT